MNSGDHDLQYSDWRCVDSGDCIVHLREQASCWEENESVEPLPRWGWCEGSCCLIPFSVLFVYQHQSSSHNNIFPINGHTLLVQNVVFCASNQTNPLAKNASSPFSPKWPVKEIYQMEHFINQINDAKPISVGKLRSLRGEDRLQALYVFVLILSKCRVYRVFSCLATQRNHRTISNSL